MASIVEAKYEDTDCVRTQKRHRIVQLKEAETVRLQGLPAASEEWGGWNALVHASGIQLNRQYRAYVIVEDELGHAVRKAGGYVIHGYRVSLERCECRDFARRNLACKHVYAVALLQEIPLALTTEQYRRARERGDNVVFRFEDMQAAHGRA